MQNTNIVVLHSAKDAESGIVETLLTHLKIMTRAKRNSHLTLVPTNVDAADFVLDEKRIQQYKEDRSVILVLVTPNLMLTDEMVGESMRALTRVTTSAGPSLLPISCLAIPNPESSPWAKFRWIPFNETKPYNPLTRQGDPDEVCCKVAEIVGRFAESLRAKQEKSAEPSTLPQNEPTTTILAKSPARIEPLTPTPAVTQSLEETKIPPLGILYAASDRDDVKAAMSAIVEILAKTRNVRAYADWMDTAGCNWKRRRLLGCSAPVLVIAISSNAIADDDLFQIIREIKPSQKVIFVILSQCMWEVLNLNHINYSVLPQANGAVQTVSTMKTESAWQQVHRAIFCEFKEPLQNESADCLSATELEFQLQFAREDAESRRQREKQQGLRSDYDLVTAYYNK